ncbi:uncharacterized protein TrAtP1_006906 [Trichoderma atroviride]|uniref:uncharacterized protein n=1 Tax=Hypocrea atroviridis TaxID=63577 RepID=UPI003332CF5E|nr:hypothetical protein TrAtP1_006906 [Trichoderma atroviride]
MEKEGFDNQKKRERSLREKMSTIMDSQSYYNHGWKTPRPIHVPYSTNQGSRFSLSPPYFQPAPNVHDARCHLTPTQTRGHELDTRAKQLIPSLNGGDFLAPMDMYITAPSRSRQSRLSPPTSYSTASALLSRV